MIVDSSAAVAVMLREAGYRVLAKALLEAPEVVIGAPTLFETELVLATRFGPRARHLVVDFLEENEVCVAPFDGRHWELAAEAFLRYGKGRHPARLNYGDCMTYATARLVGEPLLFVGEDFAKTDIAVAV